VEVALASEREQRQPLREMQNESEKLNGSYRGKGDIKLDIFS